MKKSKLKIVTKILAIVTICLISFVGIYVQKTNRMENIVKDYSLSKDLEGYRQVIFDVSDATQVQDESGNVVGDTNTYDDDTIESYKYKKTDTPVNPEDVLKTENYETSKSIMENRLKEFGVTDYNLSLDKKTGMMYLQIPEDNQTDRVISNIKELGGFEIKDSEDGTVYINSNHIKQAKAMYNTTSTGTTVYLEIQLNKEGTQILKNLSENEYATLPEETKSDENSEETGTTENETSNKTSEDENSTETEKNNSEESTDNNEGETEIVQKKITLALSGNDITTTSFDTPIVDGIIDLSMNKATTDEDSISQTLQSTSTTAVLLNNGKLPVKYTSSSQYVTTDISKEAITSTIITISIIFVILLLYMVIKYKLRGLLSAISFLGFVAIYLLLIRYTNVSIALEGIAGIVIALILDYLLSMKLLKTQQENSKIYKQEYVDFILKIIPVLIIAIIFSFIGVATLNSIGMTMFWGIALMLLYNVLITKNIVD